MLRRITKPTTTRFDHNTSTYRPPCSTTYEGKDADSFNANPSASSKAGLIEWVCIVAPTVGLGG
jgi:hypothetical protein